MSMSSTPPSPPRPSSRAGAIQKATLRARTLEIRHKGEIDLVTEVDKACEDAVLEHPRARFPEHDIVTEETDLARTGSRYVWFVDPLDGTTNFAHGYPVLLLRRWRSTMDGEAVAGAVYDRIKEELFTAERGGGAHLNGRRLRGLDRERAADAACSSPAFPTTCARTSTRTLRLFNRFMGHARAIRRDGAAALDLCYVAAGRVDGFWEERLHAWDMMAGALLIEEAGGRVSRFDGSPLALTRGPGGGGEPGAARADARRLTLPLIRRAPLAALLSPNSAAKRRPWCSLRPLQLGEYKKPFAIAGVAQLAEAVDLKSTQCGSDSHHQHQLPAVGLRSVVRSGVGGLEDAPNGGLQPGVVFGVGLPGREPLDQRPREARHDAVVAPQARNAFFLRVAARQGQHAHDLGVADELGVQVVLSPARSA